MLLQRPVSSPPSTLLQHLPFSSTTFNPKTLLGFNGSISLRQNRIKNVSITCSFSGFSSNDTVDYENRGQVLNWKHLYQKISLMENPSLGSSSVLNQWEKGGLKVTKWELCRVVKELRKYGRFKLALEVYEWMHNQGGRFLLSSSDIAIQLDLVSKVNGISSAEEYFSALPLSLKTSRTYGALLNAYVHARMREKAESLFEKMRRKGFPLNSLLFNVMMTLYLKLKEFDKVLALISEMIEINIPLDIYSYNIWMTTCGALGSTEKMEQVLERMKHDRTINPNWITYSTMATMYIMLGLTEKAEDCIRRVENRITDRDRTPYHYLLNLYSNINKKEEVYRVWAKYKLKFPKIWNMGYQTMITSLLTLGDIEGAERIYEEWLSVKLSYDPRICNVLLAWYVRNDSLEKAKGFLDNVFNVGGKVNSSTWSVLAEGHIKHKQLPEALSCMKAATSAEGVEFWRPNLKTVSSFISLCEQQSDSESKEILLEMLRKVKLFDEEACMSLVTTNGGTDIDSEATENDRDGEDNDDVDDDDDYGTIVLPNQLQENV